MDTTNNQSVPKFGPVKGQHRRLSKRQSILSDPRLSQLFQLSSQLEDLANSIEVMPLPQQQQQQQQQQVGSKTPNGNQPLLPTRPNGNSFEIQYERLEDSTYSAANGNDEDVLDKETLNQPPPRRYSTMSDSNMSLSSQTESVTLESTPSAHSNLSAAIPRDEEMAARGRPCQLESEEPIHRGRPSQLAADLAFLGQEKRVKELVDEVLIRSRSAGHVNGLAAAGAAGQPTDQAAWQTRCHELEMSLQKFRDQAQNIRELLREKVRCSIR